MIIEDNKDRKDNDNNTHARLSINMRLYTVHIQTSQEIHRSMELTRWPETESFPEINLPPQQDRKIRQANQSFFPQRTSADPSGRIGADFILLVREGRSRGFRGSRLAVGAA